MLVTYRVTNYKSFGGSQTFDLRATSQNEFPDSLYENNLLKINKKACIIGPNGAGKSQLLKSISILGQVVRTEELSKLSQPYRLNNRNPAQPSKFEIVVYSKPTNSLLSYTLSVLKGKVVKESLYSRKNEKNQHNKMIFERTEESAEIAGEYSSHDALISNISNKRLMITVLKGLNVEAIDAFIDCASAMFLFQPEFVGISASNRIIEGYLDNALEEVEDEEKCAKILKTFENDVFDYISKFDLQVKEIKIERSNEGKTLLSIIPKTNSSEPFSLSLKEASNYFSTGTFALIVLFLYLALMKGALIGILMFDEVDSSFHHKLTKKLIDVVSLEETTSQLVIATHDILLLNNNFRRDSIYTITKNEEMVAEINRLSDFSIRKDAKLSLKYLSDEFGALPKLMEI